MPLERFQRLRLRNLSATFLAGPAGVVAPEIEHRLAEMLDDIGAIKINVFDQRPAVVAIEDDVFVFSGRAASLDHYTDRVRWAHRDRKSVWRNEEGLPFAHKMIDDA